jgi:hypothetical protein
LENKIRTRKLPSNGILTGLPITSEYSQFGLGGGCPPLGNEEYSPTPRLDLQKGKLRWGGKWINHKAGKYYHLLAHGPPFYNYGAIMEDKKIDDDTKSELSRFLLTLELWETTPGKKEIRAFDVWKGSLTSGPEFASYLDDLFSISWREREIDSYNFVFPSRFLPRWVEGVDDLILSSERTYADPGVLDEFEWTLDDILSEVPFEDIVLPSDDSIRNERSTTTSYSHKLKKKMPQWEASLSHSEFNHKELIGLRTVVPVYPAGIRDTIIADISANYSIRWLERSLRHILQHVKESAVCLYSTTFDSRLKDVVYQKGYHVLRDIKKCGITYNTHDLFPIVKRVLNKYKPDIRWNRYDIYSNFHVIDEDETYQAYRGYGLGMANHTVTLCNIVIARMALNSLRLSTKGTYLSKGIVGNDDSDFVFFGNRNSERIANQYMETEFDIHGSLGNLINRKKSVIKPYGLFYEQYNKPGWFHKESLVCNALACAYLAPNIRTAKHYIYSQSDRFNSPWAR